MTRPAEKYRYQEILWGKEAQARVRAGRVGVFGVGHYNYWPQFDGLLDEMHRKLAVFVEKVEAHEVTVTNFGLVDNAPGAYALLPRLRSRLAALSLGRRA